MDRGSAGGSRPSLLRRAGRHDFAVRLHVHGPAGRRGVHAALVRAVAPRTDPPALVHPLRRGEPPGRAALRRVEGLSRGLPLPGHRRKYGHYGCGPGAEQGSVAQGISTPLRDGTLLCIQPLL